MARFLKNKKASKGAAPGSLIFIGRQKMGESLISVTQYNQAYLKEGHLKNLNKIQDYITNEHVTWISISGLQNIALIQQMGQNFNIPSLVLEDILNTDERPKFSEDEEHIYIILKSVIFKRDTVRIQIDQISFILGPDYLITLQESDYHYFEDVIARLNSGLGKIRSLPADYLCYALLDTLVDSYILNIETLGSEIEAQEKILLALDKQMIGNIYHFKTELAFARKNIRPAKEVITRFVASDSSLLHSRTLNYLKDLESLIVQSLEAVEIYYTMVSDQQNTYNSTITNNVNDVMKVLAIFSTLFIPLTFIASLYGMNFSNMPGLTFHYTYFILCGIMLIIAIVMLLYFKRKKWL